MLLAKTAGQSIQENSMSTMALESRPKEDILEKDMLLDTVYAGDVYAGEFLDNLDKDTSNIPAAAIPAPRNPKLGRGASSIPRGDDSLI